MGHKFFFVLLLALLAGCATAPRNPLPRPAQSFPPDARVTQRGILTVLGRQFTLNGYLALSEHGGKRLVVTENFGGTLADVLLKPDGSVRVIRASNAFKPEWIRHYIAADVECIFGNAPRTDCPGQRLSPTHFVIERRWYRLDLQIVQIQPGPQPAELFEAAGVTPP